MKRHNEISQNYQQIIRFFLSNTILIRLHAYQFCWNYMFPLYFDWRYMFRILSLIFLSFWFVYITFYRLYYFLLHFIVLHYFLLHCLLHFIVLHYLYCIVYYISSFCIIFITSLITNSYFFRLFFLFKLLNSSIYT